ncbi:hypothetical protein EDB86DRAFT_2994509 [Lactarius hatsudake]|nr:hypothetical protein EDB86DRAFT_2994509 [Lactarius hatsudake]
MVVVAAVFVSIFTFQCCGCGCSRPGAVSSSFVVAGLAHCIQLMLVAMGFAWCCGHVVMALQRGIVVSLARHDGVADSHVVKGGRGGHAVKQSSKDLRSVAQRALLVSAGEAAQPVCRDGSCAP